MKRTIIAIENSIVTVPQSGDIRMTAFEIAALFEVYVQTVNAGIKTILKSGVVKADISCPVTVTGNILLPDIYGLDMITTLAFRVRSPESGNIQGLGNPKNNSQSVTGKAHHSIIE